MKPTTTNPSWEVLFDEFMESCGWTGEIREDGKDRVIKDFISQLLNQKEEDCLNIIELHDKHAKEALDKQKLDLLTEVRDIITQEINIFANTPPRMKMDADSMLQVVDSRILKIISDMEGIEK